MTARLIVEAIVFVFGLVGVGLVIGWALHADRQRRIGRPVTPNNGHVRQVP